MARGQSEEADSKLGEPVQERAGKLSLALARFLALRLALKLISEVVNRGC